MSMSFTGRVKETLQAIDPVGRRRVLYRCTTCGDALDPAADAAVEYECMTCGAVLGNRPQVCPHCTRYTFIRVSIQD